MREREETRDLGGSLENEVLGIDVLGLGIRDAWRTPPPPVQSLQVSLVHPLWQVEKCASSPPTSPRLSPS